MRPACPALRPTPDHPLAMAGTILTCAHLLPSADAASATAPQHTLIVRVWARPAHLPGGNSAHWRLRWCSARVLHVFPRALDAMLLRVHLPPAEALLLCPARLADAMPVAGDACLAIGFPLYPPSCGCLPVVSAGHVSKVRPWHRLALPLPRLISMCVWQVVTLPARVGEDVAQPALVQTSCVVLQGHSGGPLLNSEGQVVALLRCNALHTQGAHIARLNFTLPLSLLLGTSCDSGADLVAEPAVAGAVQPAAPWQAALRRMSELDASPGLAALWRLQPDDRDLPGAVTLPPKPVRRMPLLTVRRARR